MPVQTLKSICLVQLVQFYRFTETEQEFMSKAIQPRSTLQTRRHRAAVARSLGTSGLGCGMLVQDHVVVHHVNNLDDDELLAEGDFYYGPAVEQHKSRTIYYLDSSSKNSEKSIAMEKAEVKVEWVWACQPGKQESLYFEITLDYKGASNTFTYAMRHSEDVNPENQIESAHMEGFIESLTLLIDDLKNALEVSKLYEHLSDMRFDYLADTLSCINNCAVDPDIIAVDRENIEILLLMALFLGNEKDHILSTKWVETSHTLRAWHWMMEVVLKNATLRRD